MGLNHKLRTILVGLVMLGGALSGVAMRPEDIERLLNVHNRVQVEQIVHEEEEDEDES
jgi:hypothetical protein